jgi:hypothetical protein
MGPLITLVQEVLILVLEVSPKMFGSTTIFGRQLT